MKKTISQILLILFITASMISLFIVKVEAEVEYEVGLNVSSATEGETFTVSLTLPEGAFGANCNVEVKYSDGTSTTVGTGGETGIAYIKGMEAMGYANSITFSAKVPGETKIIATSIVIVNEKNVFMKNGASVEETITIKAKEVKPEPNPEPEQDQKPNNEQQPTPNPNPAPDTTKPEQDDKKENNTNNTTNTAKENTVKENTTKENETTTPSFKDVSETVYAAKNCNVRSSCSTKNSKNKIGSLLKGQSVKRTGVEAEWSRIEFNGKTAYVATNLLTTEKPEENKVTNIVKNEVEDNKIQNEVENETANNTENLIENNEISEEELLNKIEQEIGVLPEVGNNIATILFVSISIIATIGIIRIQYKEKM